MYGAAAKSGFEPGGWEIADSVRGGVCSDAAAPAYPPAGWPSKDTLDYTRALILTGLLVLALPWLVTNLLTRPGQVLAGLGQRAAS